MTMETIFFRPSGWRRALVLGGARSGKSAMAERLVRETGLKRTYVATAQAFDAEMADRIARHRLDRGEGWETVEAPLDLGGALAAANRPGSAVLVDCLTLWLSNVMLAGGDVEAETAALCARVAETAGPVALVSNEVGMGLVPDTALGRAFRDAQGRLNQRMAAVCDLVAFCAAGLPLWLKTP
jgi:adenosylcobinamide kinase / adenosylcobinamide-phosphate guanylyltransferase